MTTCASGPDLSVSFAGIRLKNPLSRPAHIWLRRRVEDVCTSASSAALW
jgi:hypothetical protein